MSNPGAGVPPANTAILSASNSLLASPTSSPAYFGTSDGSDIETRAPVVFGVTLSFLILSFVVVSLRVITRKWIVQKMNPDDWIIIVAWLLSFGMCFSICLGTKYGFGRWNKDIPLEWLSSKQKLKYAFTLLYHPAIMVTKISILAFYLSIFKAQRLFRICCWITLVVTILAGLMLTLIIAFACRPLRLVLDPYSSFPNFEEGHCIGTVKIYYASAPINIITDLALIVMPMPVLTSLRLPKIQKAILIVVFGLGAFVLVVGIIRIYYFQVASVGYNFDWDAAYSFMWAALEVNVGILCASIPMIKPLVLRFFPKLIGVITTNATHSTMETEGNLDYGSGTYPEGPISVQAALHPPRQAWLSASGGHGGYVGEIEEVDAETGEIGKIPFALHPSGTIYSYNGQIPGHTFRHRSYGGGGDPLPFVQRKAGDGTSDRNASGKSQLSEKQRQQAMDDEETEEIDKLLEGVMKPISTGKRGSKRLSTISYASMSDEKREGSSTPKSPTFPRTISGGSQSSPSQTRSRANTKNDIPPWEKMDLNTHGK